MEKANDFAILSHAHMEGSEKIYYELDNRQRHFFDPWNGEVLAEKLDQFERIVNGGQPQEAESHLHIIHGGQRFYLAAKCSKDNDLRYQDHEGPLSYLVKTAQTIIDQEDRWSDMLPVSRLSQIIYAAKEGDNNRLAELLEKFTQSYSTDPKEQQSFHKLLERAKKEAQPTETVDDFEDPFGDEEDFKNLTYEQPRLPELPSLVLHKPVQAAVQDFLQSYRHRKELEAADLPWGNRILLAGPPGNGKTALAGAIANELGLPCYFCNVAEIRQSKIGESSGNIHALFSGLRKTGKAVLFLDECDSLATKRCYSCGADKEDSSALNTFLTSMDQLGSEFILIAATNYPEELDPAFVRRFSLKVFLKAPAIRDAIAYVHRYQLNHQVQFPCSMADMRRELNGQPWAKVAEFCEGMHRSLIIGTTSAYPAGWVGQADEEKHHTAGIGFHVR